MDQFHSVDIDEYIDFNFAEFFIQKNIVNITWLDD